MCSRVLITLELNSEKILKVKWGIHLKIKFTHNVVYTIGLIYLKNNFLSLLY